MLRPEQRRPSPCILAAMLALLALAGGCTATSAGRGTPDPSRPGPNSGFATPPSAIMTPPDY